MNATATTPLQQLATQQNRWEVGERFILAITGVNSTEPRVPSNSEAGCEGTLFDDNDLNNTFIKDTTTDMVFATFVTKA